MIYTWDSCPNISLLDDRVIWWNEDYIEISDNINYAKESEVKENG